MQTAKLRSGPLPLAILAALFAPEAFATTSSGAPWELMFSNFVDSIAGPVCAGAGVIMVGSMAFDWYNSQGAIPVDLLVKKGIGAAIAFTVFGVATWGGYGGFLL